MVRLNKPRRIIFSREDFDLFPVWTWDDAHEGYLPISENEPSRDKYEIFFIKTIFQTHGHKFEGYLTGLTSFYAFGIFLGGKLFLMNLRLHEFIQEDLKEIFQLLRCEPFDFFPLYYESNVRFEGGEKIKGMLTLLEE